MWLPYTQHRQKTGEAVGEVLQGESVRGVVGLSASGTVNGDDVKGVGQTVQLPSPLAAVAEGAMEQQQRLTCSRSAIGDPKPADVDRSQRRRHAQQAPRPLSRQVAYRFRRRPA